MSDHPIGSFEWAKQIVTDANAGVLAMSKPIEGSPQLDQFRRTKERAALDIAVNALRLMGGGYPGDKAAALSKAALDKIAALVPEAVPQPNQGAQQ